MSTRYGATRAGLDALIASWGEPRYRSDQAWRALYRERRPLETATSLPRSLRERLDVALPLALDERAVQRSADGLTVKWLWSAPGGAEVETVLMRYPDRATVCVSSQAGCAMGCTFCATAQGGFVRHLDTGEIVEQVMRAAHASPQPVTNVVFMGMGEPLANLDAVLGAVERLRGDAGISARRITVSTVGVVPGIRRLAATDLPVTLAVSLHAPDDELRETLVPLDRRYPIAEVLDAAAGLARRRGRRVTFEYACIAGVNDRDDHAVRLAGLLRGFDAPGGAHVNLIPLNPTAGFSGRASDPARIAAFARRLREHGIDATVRRNRGIEIDAACGQLRSRSRAGTTGVEAGDGDRHGPSARMIP